MALVVASAALVTVSDVGDGSGGGGGGCGGDGGGEAEMGREERESLVAAAAVKITLGLCAFGSFMALFVFVIKASESLGF